MYEYLFTLLCEIEHVRLLLFIHGFFVQKFPFESKTNKNKINIKCWNSIQFTGHIFEYIYKWIQDTR